MKNSNMLKRAAQMQLKKKISENNIVEEVSQPHLSPTDEEELFELMNLQFDVFEDTVYDEESE